MKSLVYILSIAALSLHAESNKAEGVVGITLSTTDFGLVTAIIPDRPAAHSPIKVGDRIVSFGLFRTSDIRNIGDLQKATSGPPGSEIELQFRHSEVGPILKVHLRRIAPTKPREIPPDFSPYQACSRANGRSSWSL